MRRRMRCRIHPAKCGAQALVTVRARGAADDGAGQEARVEALVPLECVEGKGEHGSVRVRVIDRGSEGLWVMMPTMDGRFLPIDAEELLPEKP